jgi:DNA polymerase V
VATYTARAAEKLRRQRSAAGVINVFVVPKEKAVDAPFRHGPVWSTFSILPYPTALTPQLIKPALQLATKLFQEGRLYKKAGVMLSSLVPDAAVQGNMFEMEKGVGGFYGADRQHQLQHARRRGEICFLRHHAKLENA